MTMRTIAKLAAGLIFSVTAMQALAAAPVNIVAAENFYGDIAAQIGGPDVHVTSVLSSPDQDPHLFEVSPSVARAVSGARVVVYNGIGYDPWIEKLLSASRSPGRTVIDAAALMGRKPGDNPHIWYDPSTMLALASTLSVDLTRIDPAHADDYRQRLNRFKQSLEPIETKIATLRRPLAGIPVTATEPVFNYMLQALGLQIRNLRFQLAVMNDTEPSVSEIAAFEHDLRNHRVRLLIYNSQTPTPTAKHMLDIAKTAQVPVVGVTETEPLGQDYQTWILDELDAVDHALSK